MLCEEECDVLSGKLKLLMELGRPKKRNIHFPV
jgi:hypothetical protein